MSRYTSLGTPEAESRVAADLDHLLAAVRTEAGEALLAVLLLGGYARGEGAVRRTETGALRGFNDYDLLLVFAEPPAPEPYRRLARRLAAELEIDFVDLGLATPRDLAGAPPTLFWYELGEAHRVLWRREGSEVAPRRIPRERLDPAEGSRLLLNRGLALLWAALRLWPQGEPGEGAVTGDTAERRFAVTASHKAVLAAGDAALLRHGRYDLRQAEREARLGAETALWADWAPHGFLDAYREAAAFRRRPEDPGSEGAVRLWHRGRAALEAGLRAAETARLGAFADWPEHARRMAAAERRDALRRLARRLRHRSWNPPGEAWLFGRLDALLLAGPPGNGRKEPAAWRKEGLAVVRAWHP